MEINTNEQPEKKYKSFEETYELCATSLAIGFLYPNRTNALKRGIIITLIIVFNGGQLFWFTTYTYKCLRTLDLYNFSRNMTLAVILVLFFFKTYYVIYSTQKFAAILHKMTKDLLNGNHLEEDYQEIYDQYIKLAMFGSRCWTPFIVLGLEFPVYAGICMTIEYLQTDDYRRYMVHDMELLYVEHIQDETPFFQCMFAYNCIQAIVLIPNYSGFDGSFCIATMHLCMKLKLMTHKVHRAFKDAKNRTQLRKMVNEAILDHQEALEFYQELQDVYGPWLFAVFLLTSLMISFNVYQLYLLKRIDPKYTLFGMVSILHIFLPCYHASNLTKVSEEVCSELYSVPWETWADPVVSKSLLFMMSKAQQSLIISGSGMVMFNMELFKSILQTSYSFFTLITSGKE